MFWMQGGRVPSSGELSATSFACFIVQGGRTKVKLKQVCCIAAMQLLLWPSMSSAVTAKVTAVGTYQTGAVFVYFDRPVADCSTVPRIDIPVGDPSIKHVLAVATAAFATDSNVEVRVGACAGQYPHWSSAGDTYIYLKK